VHKTQYMILFDL